MFRFCCLPLERMSEEQLLDALRAYSLIFVRLGGRQNADCEQVTGRLMPLVPSPSPRVYRDLCRVLVYLEAPGVIDKALALLKSASMQEDQLIYAFELRNLRQGWTPENRKTYFGWLQLADQKYEGGKSYQGFLAQTFRDE